MTARSMSVADSEQGKNFGFVRRGDQDRIPVQWCLSSWLIDHKIFSNMIRNWILTASEGRFPLAYHESTSSALLCSPTASTGRFLWKIKKGIALKFTTRRHHPVARHSLLLILIHDDQKDLDKNLEKANLAKRPSCHNFRRFGCTRWRRSGSNAANVIDDTLT